MSVWACAMSSFKVRDAFIRNGEMWDLGFIQKKSRKLECFGGKNDIGLEEHIVLGEWMKRIFMNDLHGIFYGLCSRPILWE